MNGFSFSINKSFGKTKNTIQTQIKQLSKKQL